MNLSIQKPENANIQVCLVKSVCQPYLLVIAFLVIQTLVIQNIKQATNGLYSTTCKTLYGIGELDFIKKFFPVINNGLRGVCMCVYVYVMTVTVLELFPHDIKAKIVI